MKIKGLFFDLGGTLFRYSGRMGGGGLKHVMSTLGISGRPEDIGRKWASASKRAGEHYASQSYFLHRDLFETTLSNFLGEFDVEADKSLFDTFHQTQLQALVDHMPIREECHDALAALKKRGLYLSIVSNIDDDYLDPLVAKHGLDEHLHHWTSSEEAQSCKPDPAIYHYALSKANLDVDEVLFVGDSLHHDVAGAHSVGMRSARIIEEGVATPLTHGLDVVAEPTHEITSLNDLITIVDEANG